MIRPTQQRLRRAFVVGQTISHYKIVELVGAGGMGVVYKAEDVRLKRPVALKFLPLELTRNPDAKARLMREAQAASALDHANICAIHEIDETADGQMFIAMAYYDGETLKQRIGRGPLTIEETLHIAVEVASAVAAAHDADIIHRDIKPANIMLTRRGEVKLLDFGLAKSVGQTAITRAGSAIGTIAYMAPEQFSGSEADRRSDVWALGVIVYEMLTGRIPFNGDTEAALLNSILNSEPASLDIARADIPPALRSAIQKALQKSPEARFGSAREFIGHLPAATPDRLSTQRTANKSRAILAATILLLIAGAVGLLPLFRSAGQRQQGGAAVADVRRLLATDDYVNAFALAKKSEPLLAADTEFTKLWAEVSRTRSIDSRPSGAAVYVRDVAQRSEWQFLGNTPLKNIQIPAGQAIWKIEKPGFESQVVLACPECLIALPETVELSPVGSLPDGMIKVPANGLALILTGYDYNKQTPAAEYLIGKYEVTNKEYKEFINAGGYQKREYWKVPFVRDRRTLSWDEAMSQFHDQTGRPGPSTWEVGTFAPGQDNYPVAGVSWYEAVAYAEFKGMSLPTIYHWLRAAGTNNAASITPLSNFDGKGLAPVGQNPALSPFGLLDAAGNVKEWCWNEMDSGSTRYILGGAYNDPDYMFLYPEARSPFDRAATNGFRLAKYLKPESRPDSTALPVPKPARDYSKEKPASDEVFRAFKSAYAYDPIPLDARTEGVDESSDIWRREKISFKATYGTERVPAYLFTPKNARPPFQTVLFWPGSGAVRTRSSENLRQDFAAVDFLLVSGRAVLYPIYFGTFERNDGRDSTWPEQTRAYRDWVIKHVNDARRAVDYLQTRPDIQHDAIAYEGFSWGARMGSIVLAQDPRFRAAVFLSGGFSPGKAPPEVDPFNFAPRVSIPVLMINGDQDFIFDAKLSQEPLFQTLGTSADRKKHLLFHAGHGVPLEKRNQVIQEVLDWLDRYVGPAK
jgi:serine/threonine protein kinase/dienelactone hydrolase